MTKIATPFTNRTEWLTQFADNDQHSDEINTINKPEQKWDVIVIGGGIVGAGILQEATRRGFKALLIEQKDFAWGTSSRSSKMVHGGLRYIAQGDIKLTKHSLQERERLLKEAPGLVNRMGYYFVIKKWQFPGRFIMSALLAVYDWLAGIKDHRYVNESATLKEFPTLASNELKGSCYYTDSVVDDSRLVMRVLQESVHAGAQALNYLKVTTLIKDPHTQEVIGVSVVDNLHGLNSANNSENTDKTNSENKPINLTSSVVINATGAWADKLRSEVIDEQRVRPLRGSHLVIARATLNIKAALTILHPSDKRPVFIFPWEGVTIVGTTDLDHQESLTDEAKITQAELDYLLLAVAKNFPENNITQSDIISTFSGVRPVISSDKHASKQTSKSPSKERRDHAIWAENGLVTASGGKLTTFRLSAIDAMNAAQPWLVKIKHQHSQEQTQANDHVFSQNSFEDIFKDRLTGSLEGKIKNWFTDKEQQKIWLQRLIGRYGNNAALLLEQAQFDEQITLGNTQFCLAECRWAIKNEAVIHLDDLLLRRTRLGLLFNQGAKELFPLLAEIFAQELGWTTAKWQDEVVRYNNIWQQYYYLPNTDNKV